VIDSMSKSKLAFIIISILFIILLLFFVIDFSRKTTFPGERTREKENNSSQNHSWNFEYSF